MDRLLSVKTSSQLVETEEQKEAVTDNCNCNDGNSETADESEDEKAEVEVGED